MNQAWWRKWHRWLGLVAAPFLTYAAITGFLLAVNEFFGEEEARRESLREVISSVKLPAENALWSGPMAKAMATVAQRFPGSPVDKVTIEFKGERPLVTVYTGKPEGGEDRKFILDGSTGELLRTEAYEDKPFLVRVHSGEAWGDGGLVFAMFWAVALLVAIFSGLVIYLKMRRPGLKGLGRIFWLVLVAVQLGLG